jgi:VanZ family protein
MILKTIFFMWLFIVTVLSVIPSPDIPGNIPGRAIHFIIYFIATALLCIAFRREKVSLFLFYSGLVFFYSTVIEIVQVFLPYRDFSVVDIVANISGILSFSFLYLLFLWISGAYRNSIYRGKGNGASHDKGL